MRARRELLAVAVLVAASACKNSAPETKQSQPASVSPSTPLPILHVPPGAPGKWVESKRYKLRVLDAAPCDEPETPGRFRLGVTVEIEATSSEDATPIFASPRGAVLEKNGSIFEAVQDPTPSPACQAFLEPKRLLRGESTR